MPRNVDNRTELIIELILNHFSLETHKRVIGKQCRPRSDATKCNIWSGSPLFENSVAILF